MTKPSGIYKLPNTSWYGDDTSEILEDILESGEISDINAPEDMVERFNDSGDTSEIREWLDDQFVELLEPTKEEK